MWRFVVLLACGGCDMMFQLDHLDRRDAAVDAPPPPCAVYLDIEFDQLGAACAPLEPDIRNGAVVTQTPDGLTIQPSVLANSYGRCHSIYPAPLTERGIMVEVHQVIPVGYTVLSLGGPIDLQILGGGGLLRLTNNLGTTIWSDQPELAYSPTEMRWWRLRRLSATELIAEYSADAKVWKRLGVRADASIEAYPYVASGTVGARTTATETAVYRRMIMCN